MAQSVCGVGRSRDRACRKLVKGGMGTYSDASRSPATSLHAGTDGFAPLRVQRSA